MKKPKAKPELAKALEKIAKEVNKWPAWKRSIDYGGKA